MNEDYKYKIILVNCKMIIALKTPRTKIKF